MKVVVWNVKQATSEAEDTWSALLGLDPDVALLQEVGGVPDSLLNTHRFIGFHAETKGGGKQRFQTGILLRGGKATPVKLISEDDALQQALDAYAGNLVHVRWERGTGDVWQWVSCYSPAWPLFSAPQELPRAIRAFKSSWSDDLWLTDILHRYLQEHVRGRGDRDRWGVAGDFNSATTFSWEKGQNQEVVDNLAAAGLVDAVSASAGGPVPTFRHSRGSIQHQLDYLYLSAAARVGLEECRVMDGMGVFEQHLSDHLPILGRWSDG
jgi:exonuclease III